MAPGWHRSRRDRLTPKPCDRSTERPTLRYRLWEWLRLRSSPSRLQDLVDEMVAEGLAASTIDSTLNPLRATTATRSPRGGWRRDQPDAQPGDTGHPLEAEAHREPEEAERLLEALREDDRAIWATALYAGLRRGELRALRFENVDLAEGLIHVERGWDDLERSSRRARREPASSARVGSAGPPDRPQAGGDEGLRCPARSHEGSKERERREQLRRTDHRLRSWRRSRPSKGRDHRSGQRSTSPRTSAEPSGKRKRLPKPIPAYAMRTRKLGAAAGVL